VLYVLDGDKSFGMTKEITDWLIWSNEIKEIIVVAITYGKGTDEWWQRRARDYSHCDDTILAKGWFRETGGADNFLKFIKYELFPAVNKNYKTNQDSTAIMGISFSGTLASYVLFTQPELNHQDYEENYCIFLHLHHFNRMQFNPESGYCC
jgi:predicted alpha/beta superfamily hydrolase